MSLNVSARPRSRNHLKESRWMATRSGSGSASSMLANEKRSGLLDRVGNGLLLPVARRMGQGRGTAVDQVSKRHGGARTAGSTTAAGAVVGGVRARDTQRKRLRKATGAGTATSKHNRKRTRSQPPRGNPGARPPQGTRTRGLRQGFHPPDGGSGYARVRRVDDLQPDPTAVDRRPGPGRCYLSSTVAPASSSWPLALSASSLLTFSSTGLGAAATATGAAAVTPNRSSNSFRSSLRSSTDSSEMPSRIWSLVRVPAIVVTPCSCVCRYLVGGVVMWVLGARCLSLIH